MSETAHHAFDSAAIGPELRVEAVHDRLRDAILRGELEADVPISQVQLAARLGVSRTPLREAVRLLQGEGLIRTEPNKRVRVAPLLISDLEEVYALRIMLEALCLKLSVPRFTSADFEELQDCLDEMDAVTDPHAIEQWERPHKAFHEKLRSYGGARIVDSARTLSDHSDRYRRVYLSFSLSFRTAAGEHKAILASCRANDPAGAAELLARHLARTALSIVATAAPERDPAPVRAALQFVINSGTVP